MRRQRELGRRGRSRRILILVAEDRLSRRLGRRSCMADFARGARDPSRAEPRNPAVRLLGRQRSTQRDSPVHQVSSYLPASGWRARSLACGSILTSANKQLAARRAVGATDGYHWSSSLAGHEFKVASFRLLLPSSFGRSGNKTPSFCARRVPGSANSFAAAASAAAGHINLALAHSATRRRRLRARH